MKGALTVGILANMIWGLSPIYYYFLGSLDPVLLLCAQVVMTFLSLALITGPQGWKSARSEIRYFIPTAALIGLNWLAYLVAILNGKALDASYGYMIAPVLTILLGQVLFKEMMTRRQLAGLITCVLAISFDLIVERRFPISGILIALPFSLYILAHKKLQIRDPVKALRTETGLMFPVAVAVILVNSLGDLLPRQSHQTIFLLALLGIVNALPLLLFVRVSAKLSPSQLGTCQFVAPVTSALVAVILFENSMSSTKILTFFGLACGMGLTIFPARNNLLASILKAE
jgi:chloramphenicol-sensitive protein RarD